MKSVVLVVTSIALSAPSFARLGETSDELKARFGEPTLTSKELFPAQGKVIEIGPRHIFKQGDWLITAVVVEGRSAKETYSHPGDWTEDQVTTVLTSNSQGAKWTETTKPGNGKKVLRTWTRADGGTARWQVGTMTVINPAYGRAKERAEAKAKAEAGRVPRI